ncbi:MAG TPA: tetratricopeptide repeat protein [Myxococcales bacterium]|jgi:tetratricopeptide (TPR) repeat protein
MKLALVLGLSLCAACNTDASAPHLARGNVLVNNGKREEAANEYREAARLAPKSALPRERLGDALYDLGQKPQALTAYRDALAVDPSSVTAAVGIARVLSDENDLPGARAALSSALERAPTNIFLLLSRSNLAARAGDFDGALADAERAAHYKSKDVPALYQYGMMLLAKDRTDEAAVVFDRLLQYSPQSPEGHYGRARVFAARGEEANAAQALAAAAKQVEPDARARLVEQGYRGEGLDAAVRDARDRSLAAMQKDPAFARWAQDPGFRRGAAWPVADAR